LGRGFSELSWAGIAYSAFPYQKFGQYSGTVVDVSHAALPEQELKSLLENTSQPTTGTFYRVTVEPDSCNGSSVCSTICCVCRWAFSSDGMSAIYGDPDEY
jgi:hypothetical protein